MATIRKKGKRWQLAILKKDGFPPVYKSGFPTKQEAKDWAAKEEGLRQQANYFPEQASQKHTLATTIDRYIELILPSKPKSAKDTLRHLTWWKEKIGGYALARVSPDLIAQYRKELSEGLTPKGTKRSSATVKLRSKAQIWIKSPHRRIFHDIVFNPKRVGHYDDKYNIWKGFAVEPIQGDCSLCWAHVKEIICNGKEAHYQYVRKWLAHLIQKPWVIFTALVLRGKQGTGKGSFVEPIGKIFGSHYAPLANLDRILGRFNSSSKKCTFDLC